MPELEKNWDFPRQSLQSFIDMLPPKTYKAAIDRLRRLPHEFIENDKALNDLRGDDFAREKSRHMSIRSPFEIKSKQFETDSKNGVFTSQTSIAQLLCLSKEELSNLGAIGQHSFDKFQDIFAQNGFVVGEFSDYKRQLGVRAPTPCNFLFYSIEYNELERVLDYIQQQDSANDLTPPVAGDTPASTYGLDDFDPR